MSIALQLQELSASALKALLFLSSQNEHKSAREVAQALQVHVDRCRIALHECENSGLVSKICEGRAAARGRSSQTARYVSNFAIVEREAHTKIDAHSNFDAHSIFDADSNFDAHSIFDADSKKEVHTNDCLIDLNYLNKEKQSINQLNEKEVASTELINKLMKYNVAQQQAIKLARQHRQNCEDLLLSDNPLIEKIISFESSKQSIKNLGGYVARVIQQHQTQKSIVKQDIDQLQEQAAESKLKFATLSSENVKKWLEIKQKSAQKLNS